MARILVLDNYDGFREAMEYCLPKFGHSVCSSSVTGAVASIFHPIPDVILIGVGQSSSSGFDVCAMLKRDPVLGGVPILILANPLNERIHELARAAGAAAVLGKPFEWREFHEVLHRIMGFGAEAEE
jgi:CheY-like chemotaxis protein